jgi:antitoxin VapB
MPERVIAKLFLNGRSQAVRLPKEFRFRGDKVHVRRVDNGVLLEPVLEVKDWFARLDKFAQETPLETGLDQPSTPAREVFD